MNTTLVTTSAIALLAMMTIALAQTPKGGEGQKETSPPAMKDSGPTDKDATKAGEKKEAPDKKGQEKATKDSPKDSKKEASDKDKARDTKKDAKKEASDKDKDKAGKDGSKEAAGKDGKGDKGGGVQLSQEQRTKVQSSFAKHKRQSANVNISINVGVAVPRTVQVYAIPQDIIVIVPAYRRYRYFVVDNRICIVDPDTYEIVDIIIIA